MICSTKVRSVFSFCRLNSQILNMNLSISQIIIKTATVLWVWSLQPKTVRWCQAEFHRLLSVSPIRATCRRLRCSKTRALFWTMAMCAIAIMDCSKKHRASWQAKCKGTTNSIRTGRWTRSYGLKRIEIGREVVRRPRKRKNCLFSHGVFASMWALRQRQLWHHHPLHLRITFSYLNLCAFCPPHCGKAKRSSASKT